VVLPTITLQPVEVMAGSREQEDRLVFADGQLAVVRAHLDDPVHEDERGGWFLEVEFCPLNGARQPVFGSLEESQARVDLVRSAINSVH
jgi:hypothetical protein